MGAIRSYFRRTAMRGSLQFEMVRSINRLLLALHNRMIAHGTILVGTTTSKVKTTSIITYTVDGLFLTKAATDDLFVLTLANAGAASTSIPIGYTNKVWLGLDSAGAATAYEGVPKLTANLANDPVKLEQNYPDSVALVGTVTLANASAAAVVPGTVVLATAGGLTVTFSNGVDTGALPLLGELSQQISL